MKTDFWSGNADGTATCDLCPHSCRIVEGRTGLCGTRGTISGALTALCYGMVSSIAMDPIEKKPLYHFYPGREILSIGGWGCNLSCCFCQNWNISQQVRKDGQAIGPEALVAAAVKERSVGIAYTYNEPLINFEFVMDCCRLARDMNLKNVLVTNGFINSAPANAILPLVDALNIDIKSMDESFYSERCRGSLSPALSFASQSARIGCHVEITNLVIPGLNDRDDLFDKLARWISYELGRHTPLHLSAYRPEYRLTAPPTPTDTLMKARDICLEHLDYVYVGNIRSGEGQDTLCPQCRESLIKRVGHRVEVMGLSDGSCSRCRRKADIIFR